MDYNDIIIITLLVVIIGLVLLKKDYTFFSDNFTKTQTHENYVQENYAPYSNQSNNLNYSHYNNMSSLPPNTYTRPKQNTNGISINERLDSIKKNKDKSSVIIKNRHNSSKKIRDNVYEDADIIDDIGSLDDISLKEVNITNKKLAIKKALVNNSRNDRVENIKQNKKNEEINKKVIIDDYSEFDNIKSLNSMDNTLSDVVSIVDKD